MLKNNLYRFALSKIVVIVLCAMLFGGLTVSLANDAFAFVKNEKEITFSLSEPTSLYKLSTELQNSGIIENAFGFWIYAKYRNSENYLEKFYGTIDLNSAMSYREIINQIKNFEII